MDLGFEPPAFVPFRGDVRTVRVCCVGLMGLEGQRGLEEGENGEQGGEDPTSTVSLKLWAVPSLREGGPGGAQEWMNWGLSVEAAVGGDPRDASSGRNTSVIVRGGGEGFWV